MYIPLEKEYYPEIVKEGWSVAETEKWADDHNVDLVIKYEETNDYTPGTIFKQSRDSSSVVVEGAKLTITVATKKEEPVSNSSTNTKPSTSTSQATKPQTSADTTSKEENTNTSESN